MFKKTIFGVSAHLVFLTILIYPSLGFATSYELYPPHFGVTVSTPLLFSVYSRFVICSTTYGSTPGAICPQTTIDLGLNGGKLNAGLIAFGEGGMGELNLSYLRTWNNVAGLTGGNSNYLGLTAAAHIFKVSVQVGIFDRVSHGESEGRRVLYNLGVSYGY